MEYGRVRLEEGRYFWFGVGNGVLDVVRSGLAVVAHV
jgi:hypothetical protein